MTQEFATIDRLAPSAIPSEAEIVAWEALPRNEQLRRLRAMLGHADCATATPATMADILAEACARAGTQATYKRV
ncbi:MAG: hypothetical protein C3F11_06185 [Methylocystaceae bacterium]|nr:MAG: hypothetical protein C3F11_06185 [Methylocystaceae bacterium]